MVEGETVVDLSEKEHYTQTSPRVVVTGVSKTNTLITTYCG